MTTPPDQQRPAVASRRTVLAGFAALAAGSGCLQRARSVVHRSRPEQISLSIKSVPTDMDPRSIFIARFLARNLQQVGIAAEVSASTQEELLRDVLINQEFDIYVARHPENNDPDFLRPLLHSRFDSEPGWQNPFGYANLEVDDLLERQCWQSGRARIETLRELQRAVVADAPFSVVAFPDDIRAVREDRVAGWTEYPLHTAQSYLRLRERRDFTGSTTAGEDSTPTSPDESEDRGLLMTMTDTRSTKNLNPLSVEFRDGGVVTGLLYDPLVRWIDGTYQPWLAASIRWLEEPETSATTAEVTLRDGLAWHDGESITAEDVAFTYQFLADTALGSMDIPVPAPRFRGESSLVERVSAVDDATVHVQFKPSYPETAAAALTVPMLPKHVWEPLAVEATVASIGNGSATEALVTENLDPVGSGPFQYERSTVNEQLVLRPFREHFLEDGSLDAPLDRFSGGFSFDRLTFLVVPSGEAAVELLLAGDADGTASSVMPRNVPRVGYSGNVRLDVERSTAFYHIGFNLRSAPLSNARFRRGVAQLLDKEYLSEQVLDGFASPAVSPLAPYEAMAPELAWDGEDAELPFPGEDGQLDLERAREPFIEAGYRYREEDQALVT